jgi:hypothetical protein
MATNKEPLDWMGKIIEDSLQADMDKTEQTNDSLI